MRALIAIALVATLTGCATLPVSGPVRIGPDLATPTDGNSFYYSPASPVDGATETEILSGFISAGTAPQNDYAIAREFLDESIRATWNPNQELLIQRSTPKITFTDAGTALVEVEVSARIDANGRYETLPAGSTRVLEYEFTEQAGQVRIDRAPDVTMVIRPVFDVVFRSYSVYFLDKSRRTLVPELRWFPSNPATGTKLVNALLAGPSSWLEPAVISAIPTGTVLSTDAVTVQQETALVDLSARALVAGLSDRSLMKAQLVATLSQLPTITEVAISIERSAQDIPDSQVAPAVTTSGTLLAVGENGLEALSGANPDSFAQGLSFFSSRSVSKLAASKTGDTLAVLTESGVFETALSAPGSSVEEVDPRSTLAGLEYDSLSYLWLAAGSKVSVNSLPLQASWLAGQSIVDFSLSPEGSRVALVVSSGEGNQVLIAPVIRKDNGVPIELGAPISIGSEIDNPVRLSWFDSVTVAVVNDEPDVSSIALVSIGGTTRLIQGVAEVSSLVALGDGTNLYALKESGELVIYRGSFWSSLKSSISAIALAR
jgi:hypothetical protein